MTVEEAKSILQIALDWCIEEHWNPYPHEFEAFYHLHKEGYYILEIFNPEKKIWEFCTQIIVPVSHELKRSSVGYYITRKDLRRKGYGGRLWKETVSKVPKDYNSRLAGVITMADSYEKEGFKRNGLINGLHHDNLEKFQTKSSRCHLYSDLEAPQKKVVLDYIEKKTTSFFLKYISFLLDNKCSLVALFLDEEKKKVGGVGIVKPLTVGIKFSWIYEGEGVELLEELFRDMCFRFKATKKIFLETKEKTKGEKFLVEVTGEELHPYCVAMTKDLKVESFETFLDLGYFGFYQ